ncbi:MAG TPA: FAD-dependent oxidoreductase [Candidatus Sulfotelmatobacter sp.]|nr:FAD-dependent oxidoreductase [Candidatus Sulfotelmatobacter sp.]
MSARIAVVGAGIYGSYTAIRLAESGHRVELFDPLGVLRGASDVNQFRIHAGYHYPRSPETIEETLETRAEFISAFAPAIVRGRQHYYAIPKQGSLTSPDAYERMMARHNLCLRPCKPSWMDFSFIDRCYEVDEHLYDPQLLRQLLETRICALRIKFHQTHYPQELRREFDFVIHATYGLGSSRGMFRCAKYQVAEKMLIELPPPLRSVALVIVDGPFTAFDPYGNTSSSQFGSAKHTNHWTTTDPCLPIPEPYASLLNRPEFKPVPFSRFAAMRSDAALAVPLANDATYIGSRFTIRVVEDNPKEDRRTLYIQEPAPREIHIFSGKVVCAAKAARLICERINFDD